MWLLFVLQFPVEVSDNTHVVKVRRVVLCFFN